MKKKLLMLWFGVVLCCMMLAVNVSATVWDGTAASGFAGGTGTENDPYQIATAEQLAYLAQSVNNGTTYEGQYIKLTDDIVLNNTDLEDWTTTAKQWIPIGNSYRSFSGTFNGGEYSVGGLYINSKENYIGLFGNAKQAIFKSVKIVNSYVTGGQYVGSIVGYCNSDVFFDNCTNSGDVVAKSFSDRTANAGGIAGYCNASSTIVFVQCKNSGKISSQPVPYNIVTAGGIAGRCVQNVVFTDCTNNGNISSLSSGGISGYCDNAVSFVKCINSGEISSSSSRTSPYAGGITGYCGSESVFKDCNNSESISSSHYSSLSSTSYTGGIVGECGTSCEFTNCINSGNISASSSNSSTVVGGISASCRAACTISNCTNQGSVSAATSNSSKSAGAGGIVGICNLGTTIIRNCYNTGNSTGNGIVYSIGSGEISSCYSLGRVNTNAIAPKADDVLIKYCYYLHDSGANNTTATALTEEQMKQQSSFVGFDFTNIWTMGNADYPYPVFRKGDAAVPVITEQSLPFDCCAGENIVLSVSASISDEGILSYQWYVSDTAETEGQAIEGATSADYMPSTENVVTKYYYVIITNTLGESTASIKSDVIKVTVKPNHIIGDIDGDGEVTIADALYLLRHTILPERYLLSGSNADYNDNGSVDAEDAVYLMYHTLEPEQYPLEN